MRYTKNQSALETEIVELINPMFFKHPDRAFEVLAIVAARMACSTMDPQGAMAAVLVLANAFVAANADRETVH